MNEDNESGGNKRLSRAEQDRTDLNNEMAGREVGRINRFLPEDASPAALKKRNERHQERLSALMALLKSDSEYAALYNDTMDQLRRAELATERALSEANATLSQARIDLRALRDRASELPDGTKVFRGADGTVWDEHGNKVTGPDLDQITWRDAAPTYQDYLARRKALDAAQQAVDAILRYQVDVLGDARNRLTDEDNPPSKDELRDIQKRIEDDMPFKAQTEPETSEAAREFTSSTTADIKLPPIGS